MHFRHASLFPRRHNAEGRGSSRYSRTASVRMFDAIGSAVCRNLEYAAHRRPHRAFAPTRARARRVCICVSRSHLQQTRRCLKMAPVMARYEPGSGYIQTRVYVCTYARTYVRVRTYAAITIRVVTDFFRPDPSRIPASSRAVEVSNNTFRLIPRFGDRTGGA